VLKPPLEVGVASLNDRVTWRFRAARSELKARLTAWPLPSEDFS
jgi:hypothetical protein